jgi:dipeptidyl aminopeptidase/acylaminoacyl peptidase
VPNQQSRILYEALQAAGATATFHLVPGKGHDDAIATMQTPMALEMLKAVFGR